MISYGGFTYAGADSQAPNIIGTPALNPNTPGLLLGKTIEYYTDSQIIVEGGDFVHTSVFDDFTQIDVDPDYVTQKLSEDKVNSIFASFKAQVDGQMSDYASYLEGSEIFQGEEHFKSSFNLMYSAKNKNVVYVDISDLNNNLSDIFLPDLKDISHVIIYSDQPSVSFSRGSILSNGQVVDTGMPNNPMLFDLADKVTWVLPNAVEMSIEGYGVIGDVYAPNATLDTKGGSLNGSLYVNNLISQAGFEVHNFGNRPIIPEKPVDPVKPEPSEPSESTTEPTEPSESTTEPTKPSESTTEPTIPSESTTEPTIPSESTTEPTIPSESTTEPTIPSEPTTEPTIPSESTTEPTKPSESTTEPTIPSESTTEPTIPSESTTEPTIPSESTTEPTKPSESTTEPTIPSESTTEPTKPSESTTEPTIPSESTTEPTIPSESTTEPTIPSESTTEPTIPSEPTTEPTIPSESTTEPTKPSESTTEPNKPNDLNNEPNKDNSQSRTTNNKKMLPRTGEIKSNSLFLLSGMILLVVVSIFKNRRKSK
ncbi:collagen-binding domain-containing protein [Vagococcus hydrophili]|uniref:Choice-of-anchor A family protein n=1 Tax=Vagococcus hydrophili TaxID=2714947 RepID=A0A6G8ATC8_9ENTE|nr:collagen-binding domain-containing protein [Vagococcus hydrophili]QIL48247.1 choice-of-anchor A family protein [Vagococcus hydrophili]